MTTPYDTLRIAALPIDIAEADVQANINAVEAAMQQMPKGADLVILPELFSTGFVPDKSAAPALAETGQGNTMKRLGQLADEHSCAIAGSFLAKSGPWLYNRAFFIEPGGETFFYDKRHLFSLSSEAEIFKAGSELPPVVRFRGWNIALAVCYDLRFPVWLRNRNLEYDLLIIPANWPQKRAYAWTTLLAARAIENQAYVAGVNRSGQDAFGLYDGLTAIYDYTGKPFSAGDAIVTAQLSMATLKKFRNSFPFWRDADPLPEL